MFHFYLSKILYGLFGLRGERGQVEENIIELIENKLILGQIYSILLYSTLSSSPLIQTGH